MARLEGAAPNKAVEQVMSRLESAGLSPREDRVARGLDDAADQLHRDELLALVRMAEGREPAVAALSAEAELEFEASFRWTARRVSLAGMALVVGAGIAAVVFAGDEGLAALALSLVVGAMCAVAAYLAVTVAVARRFDAACLALYCAAWIADPENAPSPLSGAPDARPVEGSEEELRAEAQRCEDRKHLWEGVRAVSAGCLAFYVAGGLFGDDWQWPLVVASGVAVAVSWLAVELAWRREGDVVAALDKLSCALLPPGRDE